MNGMNHHEFNEINCNITIGSYDYIKYALFKVFHNSFNEGIFPDKLKKAKVVPSLKLGDSSIAGNYRPISVLPVFAKTLERIMYNRVCSYLTKMTYFRGKNLVSEIIIPLNMQFYN